MSAEPTPAPRAPRDNEGWAERRLLTATAIRHVAFEDLGILDGLLAERDVRVSYVDAPRARLAALDPVAPDLLVVLGGPIGACETEAHPFLAEERALVAARLAAGRPTLGICLGAQLIAAALGARVYPTGVKEIGWAPVALTDAGKASCLAPLGAPGVAVLHWHGDTFELPEGAVRLASTAVAENQAFAWGAATLGLQFHLETPADAIESWLVGHTVEIAAAGLTAARLRAETARHAARCMAAGRECLAAWLDGL